MKPVGGRLVRYSEQRRKTPAAVAQPLFFSHELHEFTRIKKEYENNLINFYLS